MCFFFLAMCSYGVLLQQPELVQQHIHVIQLQHLGAYIRHTCTYLSWRSWVRPYEILDGLCLYVFLVLKIGLLRCGKAAYHGPCSTWLVGKTILTPRIFYRSSRQEDPENYRLRVPRRSNTEDTQLPIPVKSTAASAWWTHRSRPLFNAGRC